MEYKNKALKSSYYLRDPSANSLALDCVCVSNKQINRLDNVIYLFTYMIKIYAAAIYLCIKSGYLDNSYFKHKI